MTAPDYSFAPFLARRQTADYYRDAELLPQLFHHYAGERAARLEFGIEGLAAEAAGRYRAWAETAALPENRPWLLPYDGHGNRVDRIVRPLETRLMEREIFGLGLFRAAVDPWERLVKLLILHQNGEHGVACALACTQGLVVLGDALAPELAPPVREAWQHCKEGRDGDYGIAAQFLSEIQGGSDVAANRASAVPDGPAYRLAGTKFFCSAAHADYALVTARVAGDEGVSLFLVPTWLTAEDRAAERRNHQRIRRLKRKLGTWELPTAEIEYDGALAWLVGRRGRGLPLVVAHVLTTSRLAVSIFNVAAMLRAFREARLYAEFRTVFGRPVGQWPLTAALLEDLRARVRESLAGLFAVHAEHLALGGVGVGFPRDADLDLRRRRLRLRLLILLQKATTARDCVVFLERALSVFGGHGVMECFSDLPRLLRDAHVNEQWEGPRNLLLYQIYHDLRRAAEWYPRRHLPGRPGGRCGPGAVCRARLGGGGRRPRRCARALRTRAGASVGARPRRDHAPLPARRPGGPLTAGPDGRQRATPSRIPALRAYIRATANAPRTPSRPAAPMERRSVARMERSGIRGTPSDRRHPS
ncbi:MAG: hypothetical protein KatS3mg124_0316 [Porticoccaceae bacterium]|nr:MAG: hypothetical protein KatS3mg124_0316 [Porticoccaceae bacterium]